MPDQFPEQGMGLIRPGFEFGMELDAHMETAAGGFHCLDQGPVRRSAADGQTRLLQLLPICIVEFKTMSVAFGNLRCAVLKP